MVAQRGQGNFQASKDDNSFYLCYFTSKVMWILLTNLLTQKWLLIYSI